MISHESIHKWVYPLIENYNRSLYKEYECKPNSDFIKSLNLILADTSGIELGNVYGRKDSNDHLDLIFVIGESSDPKKPVKIVDNGLAGKFLQIAKLAEEQNLIQKNSNENHIDSGVPPPPPYRGFPSLMKKRK